MDEQITNNAPIKPAQKPNFWQKFVAGLKKVFHTQHQDTHQFRKRMVWGIIIGVLAVLVILIVVFGVGLYKYHWQNKTAKIAENIIPYPAAFVGTNVILLRDYDVRIRGAENYYAKMKQKIGSDYRALILDQMIDEKIVARQAKKMGIKVSDKEVEDQYKQLVAGQGGEAQVKKLLSELWGWDVAYLKQMIATKILEVKMQEEIPKAYNISHILFKFPNHANDKAKEATKTKAENAKTEIEKGKKFEAMVKEFSQDTATKDKKGSLGWLTKAQVEKKLSKDCADVVSKLSVDKLGICSSQFGYHVVKVTEKRGKYDETFAQWLKNTKKNTKLWIWVNTD